MKFYESTTVSADKELTFMLLFRAGTADKGIHRFNTMNFAVYDVILVKEFEKMGVRRLQVVNPVDLVRKFFGKFMGNVGQFGSPLSGLTMDTLAL